MEADFPRGIEGELGVYAGANRFVDGLARFERGAWLPVDRAAAAAACRSPCRLRYAVRLADAARELGDIDTALASGGAVFAPPSSWLLRPSTLPRAGRFRFHVVKPAGVGFATAVRRAPSGAADTFEADVRAIREGSSAAFGALRIQRVADPSIDVVAARDVALDDEAILRWMRAELSAVESYFDRRVDDHLVVFLSPGRSRSMSGKTLGHGGAAVLLRLGTGFSAANLLDDWVVVHELVHVAFPSLAARHTWFSEGLATYVEPLARVRAGRLPVEKVWADLADGLPHGLPRPGDPGLDGTRDWGRVYWGGALYFLVADVAIREQTNNVRSLDHALRAIAATGANVETHWSIERVLDEGDRATGTRVLHDVYEELALAPGTVDLAALWTKLGVVPHGGSVRFDDGAPGAAVRAAITAPPRSAPRVEGSPAGGGARGASL